MEKLKLIPLSLVEIDTVWNFLKAKEAYCVQLCERLEDFLTQGKNNGEFMCLVEKKLLGVIFVSKAGLVLHSFEDFLKDSYSKEFIPIAKKILANYFLGRKVYCISGKSFGTKLIFEALKTENSIEPVEIRDYNLMEFDGNYKNLYAIPIKTCSLDDLDKLFYIQSEYDKIEVIPSTYSFDRNLCTKNLFRSLQKGRVFAIDVGENNYIAKASINAKSSRFIQIGGVFTDSAYRGKGYAAALVNYIATNGINSGHKVVLFVRKDNLPAIHSYTKAGFKRQESYSIIYY